MDPRLKKELEEKARKKREAKEMEAVSEKNLMFKQLDANNNVDTMDDCTQLVSTIASIIGDGELVDLKGKDSAIGTVRIALLLLTTFHTDFFFFFFNIEFSHHS